MELNSELQDNLKQLGYVMHDVTSGELFDLVPQLGYVSLNKGTTYEDGTNGLLMKVSEPANKYNNGIYMLHRLTGGEIVMEVIVPNTNDKGTKITDIVDNLSTHIDGLNIFDLTVFDYSEITGYVVANAVIKPLAKSLFPNDELKQDRFTMLYMSRFLSNVAHMYAGDDSLLEEGVNSEPYVLKMMIDNPAPESTNADKPTDKTSHESATSDKSTDDSTPDEKKAPDETI